MTIWHFIADCKENERIEWNELFRFNSKMTNGIMPLIMAMLTINEANWFFFLSTLFRCIFLLPFTTVIIKVPGYFGIANKRSRVSARVKKKTNNENDKHTSTHYAMNGMRMLSIVDGNQTNRQTCHCHRHFSIELIVLINQIKIFSLTAEFVVVVVVVEPCQFNCHLMHSMDAFSAKVFMWIVYVRRRWK